MKKKHKKQREVIEDKIDLIMAELKRKYPNLSNYRWHAIKLLEQDKEISARYPVNMPDVIDRNYESDIINEKYDFIEEIIREVLVNKERNIAANKIPHIADVFRFGGHRLFRIFAHSAGLHYNRICFCADGACFVMRAKDEIEHIFSELYSVPDRLQKPYFMLKVQELLLFLCMVDVNKEKQRELYTSPQVEIVRDIHKRLISNLQERPTIEELSKEYLINTATLKDTFKGVYGQPIGTYMKVYRMKQAAALLRQTQATIAEIASQVGYENQSKFATAFRDVMKIAPAEYRKQNSGD